MSIRTRWQRNRIVIEVVLLPLVEETDLGDTAEQIKIALS